MTSPPAGTPFLEALDEAPLTRRFYVLAGVTMLGAVLDLFDFFLIAFVTPDLADEWDLTFGQAAAMLLAAGVGAIGGSIFFGRLGDRVGRRKPLMAGHRHVLARDRRAGAGARWGLVVRRAAAPGRGSRGRRSRGNRGAADARVHSHSPADPRGRLRDDRDGADRHHGRRRVAAALPWRAAFASGCCRSCSFLHRLVRAGVAALAGDKGRRDEARGSWRGSRGGAKRS